MIAKIRRNRLLWLLLFLSWFSMNDGAVHKILFIGDSITYGKGDVPGFRGDVYWSLQNMGFPFEFVGSVNETPPFRGYYFISAYTPDFYEKNGQYNIAGEMDFWKPTIAVIHLGTNDFWLSLWIEGGPYSNDGGQTFTDQVSGHLARLLAYLTQWHDGRLGTHLQTIFLCQIIPKEWRHMGPTGIPMLNEDLDKMVQDIEAGQVPSIPAGLVRLVDQFTGFTNDMLSDGNHPNGTGYYFMTKNFINAFKTLPMHLICAEGWDQQALPGHPLPEPVVFQVTDGFGNPAPGIPVQLQVSFGDADILSPVEAMSDASGRVYADIALGWTDSSVVRAHASGLIDSIATGAVYPRDHVMLSGKIDYFGNTQPVSEVAVRWEQTDQVTYSYSDGSFEMDGVALQASPTLIPGKETAGPVNIDISIFEAAVIARHVVGIEPFAEAQKSAGDVNGDGEVTIEDAVTVARLVVDLIPADSTAIGQWQFWPASTTCDSVTADIDSLHFTAIRVGDLQSSWSQPGDAVFSVEPGSQGLSKSSHAQGTLHVPIWIHGGSILAGQFTAAWDTSEIELADIRGMNPEFYFSHHCIEPGRIRVALFSPEPVSGDVQLITLCFQVKNEADMPNIKIEAARINNLAVTQIAEKSHITDRHFELGANYPDPFNGQTVIPFHADGKGELSIQVVNILGKKIKTLYQGYQSAGNKQIIWDGRDDTGIEVPSGIYFLLIQNEQQRITERMEVIR